MRTTNQPQTIDKSHERDTALQINGEGASSDNLFGEVISRYTRMQAIEDGVLVDLMQDTMILRNMTVEVESVEQLILTTR